MGKDRKEMAIYFIKTHQMKQPKMKRLADWEIFKVASIVWMDNGKTCRAFPMSLEQDWVTNYVVVKWEWETTEVWAELIFED